MISDKLQMCLALDLPKVSFLINKQMGGGQKEEERGKGKERGGRARLVNYAFRKRDRSRS